MIPPPSPVTSGLPTFHNSVPGARTYREISSFFSAARYNLELFKRLVPQFPDLINHQNDEGKTLVHLAVEQN